MKYSYEDMSDEQFEDLIVCICKEIFGIGTQGFTKGPDGGRDGKFVGMAQFFPSTTSPWQGITIVQAKHTNAYNKSYSETDFYGNKASILNEEIPRIKKLREQNELDNYILFSNRRLTGNTESSLRKIISDECNIPYESISFQDVWAIEGWIKRYPNIIKCAAIDPIDSPLTVSPDELAEVIEAFARQRESFSDIEVASPTLRTASLSEKNKLNVMSEEYSRELTRRHLKDVATVQLFLALPENDEIRELYQLAVDEFNIEIIAKRKKHQSFDEVLQYLKKLLTSRDPILKKNKRLTELVLFYMYWDCDIGENESADGE